MFYKNTHINPCVKTQSPANRLSAHARTAFIRSKKKTAGLKPAILSKFFRFFARYGRFRL